MSLARSIRMAKQTEGEMARKKKKKKRVMGVPKKKPDHVFPIHLMAVPIVQCC